MKNFAAILLTLLIATSVVVFPISAKPIPVKKAIPVHQTTAKVVSSDTDGTQNAVVVLPPGFENHDVVVADSTEYKKLLSDNVELQKQVAAEKEWETKYIAETQKVQQDQANALAAEQKKSGGLSSMFSWVKWIMGGGIITTVLIGIGLIVLCCFMPELIPVVEEFLVGVVKWIVRIVKAVVTTIKQLIALIPKKSAVVAPTPTPVVPPIVKS